MLLPLLAANRIATVTQYQYIERALAAGSRSSRCLIILLHQGRKDGMMPRCSKADVIGVSQWTACGNTVVIRFMNSVVEVGVDGGEQIVVGLRRFSLGEVAKCQGNGRWQSLGYARARGERARSCCNW